MDIKEYQELCKRAYKAAIHYPESYTYLTGGPIKVQIPLETTVNKVMIVGAYPSAKFYTVQSNDGTLIRDVPLDDNDSPFSNETYLDGKRLRTIPSGKELNEVILHKIGVLRQDCWITDLVKVFLFKEGHVKKYQALGKFDIEPNRKNFEEYAELSLKWLYDEIEICNPCVIILLGMEVTSAVLKLKPDAAKEALNGIRISKLIKEQDRQFICLPHPGILMRKNQNGNTWPQDFENSISVNARAEIARLLELN
jgi:uracil-DNA glycosylase